jgi:formate dehydrogenase major subunit
MSSQQNNPAAKISRDDKMDVYGTPDKYPHVATTYRVSEHWQAGAMTRSHPWLLELMPDAFVEIGADLAKEKNIANGDRVKVSTARGSIEVYALVTHRLKPMRGDGRWIHHVGIPWHYGYAGLATGDIANTLTPNAGDANTHIPEYKAFLCAVDKA